MSYSIYIADEAPREIYQKCPVKTGDVLYFKDGTTTGVATVNQLKDEFPLLSRFALLKPDKSVVRPSCLKYMMNNKAFKKHYLDSVVGGAMKRFTVDTIKRLIAIALPLQEQNSFAKFPDVRAVKTDALINLGLRNVTLLTEYRAALISAAVTGKIDVRGGAA